METRSHFHAELDALKNRVVQLGTLVQHAREQAVAAYLRQDAAAARRVIVGDAAINRQTCEIDEACLRLLALEQPVALDLRRIVGYARAGINLERLGDEAVTIAEGALTGGGLPAADTGLEALAEHVGRMCSMAVAALEKNDLDQAIAVCHLDEIASELAVAALRHATEAISQCLASPEAAVRAILAIRSFERMGGHAANVAETLVFIIKGVIPSQQCQPR